jgi:hypothetical protein
MYEEMLARARNADLRREVESAERGLEMLRRAREASRPAGERSRHKSAVTLWRTVLGLR